MNWNWRQSNVTRGGDRQLVWGSGEETRNADIVASVECQVSRVTWHVEHSQHETRHAQLVSLPCKAQRRIGTSTAHGSALVERGESGGRVAGHAALFLLGRKIVGWRAGDGTTENSEGAEALG